MIVRSLKTKLEKGGTVDYREVYYAFFTYLETLLILNPELKDKLTNTTIDLNDKEVPLMKAYYLATSSPITFADEKLAEKVLTSFLNLVWPKVLEVVEEHLAEAF